jgi:hypothetical protein
MLPVGNIPWRQITPQALRPASEKRMAIPEMQQRSVQPKEKCIDEYAFF